MMRWLVMVGLGLSLTSHARAQDVETPSSALPSPVALPPAYDEDTEQRTQNLDLWLEHYAAQAEGPRISGGVITLAVGVGVIPLEVWLLTQIDARSSSGSTLLPLVGLTFGLAAMDIAIGILRLAMPSIPEQRLSRWRAMRANGPISARELGRFEGEIRGELVQLQDARWTELALGIGISAASIVGFVMTAVLAEDSTAQLVGYVASGAFALIGIVFSVLPWFFDQPDREWEQIEQGQPPIAFAPWASPDGGGFALNGTF